jgi:RHS repeat-associated protein
MDVAGVLGSDYEYRWEGTFKPTYARSRTDATLDRYYGYDHVGRLHVGRTGSEARAANGEGWNGQYDGPYSTGMYYDVWGNLTLKEGWGGVNPSYTATYTNNRRNGFEYDTAGNLTNDGQQIYSYDAQGRQTYASGTGLQQSYDGDGLRVKKTEGGATTYYLRSSALGQQVVAEINGYGGWQRGYVYLGSKLLALQDNGVLWVHQDPVTKSQRLTDSSGNVVSWVELDPWGGETGRSVNSQRQPRRYTTYERDGNGGDEAMMRRYEGRWQRFAQPDPFDGSYNLTDPQSFNRYSYVQNDPVTFTDPSGLQPCWGAECGWGSVSAGFWGWGDLMNRPRNTGREIIREAERYLDWLMQEWLIAPRGGKIGIPQVSDDLYQRCKGRAASVIPKDAAEAILNTASVEGIDPTLLSVTWRNESGFSFNPKPNPRYEGKGRNRKLVGYDTGPMQISTNYYDKSPFTDGLPGAFGTFAMDWNTKEYAPFNGDPYDNLRAGARAYTKDILSRSRNNADAAGLFRAGSRTGPGYSDRSAQYTREASRDRSFFDCLMGR